MSRSKTYQRLLNDKRWKVLRQEYLQAHPLCERCWSEGEKISSAVDVHHIVPVESGKTLAEIQTLCYARENLQALCVPCHIKTHAEERSHSKEAHKQREDDRLSQWISRQSRRK